MTNDPSGLQAEIEYDVLVPQCRLCDWAGPVVLLALPEGEETAMAVGAQHVLDRHPAASPTAKTFALVDLVIAVPAGHPDGIEAVQAAIDRANARNLLAKSA
ncbi:hypothetical protein [Kitasatospora cineracea]|uniref:hypothetical protein n=1 Tax=Kitasatospora cineracea TaxID=88074 RepID=UPI0036824B0B